MEFSDQDLRQVFNRALRNVVIATGIGIPIVWIAWGWRSMLLFLVGGVIAATGIIEWRQLMTAILVRLDHQAETGSAPRPVGAALFWFFVRLIAAAGLLYVSLRSLDGKVAALLLGIGLALAALIIEALRLFRGWTA
jgi:hypothetical protein